ncbi:hypothetical protein LX87_01731 [Larkinella arboricola]|uniref:Uncharacterized protein n=1 Tax=Larkinella arboricola TaxID=643671 RepID=A0A327X3Y3_LARAB|nr:hypothetical protein LX87_01731 [Larkinella arboricola]
MKHLLPIIALLPLAVTAQKVDKTVSVQYADFLKTAHKPTVAAVSFDPATQLVQLYGWHPLVGRLKEITPKGDKKPVAVRNPKRKAEDCWVP